MKSLLLATLLVSCVFTVSIVEKDIIKLLTNGPSGKLIAYVEDLNKNHYSLDKMVFYAPKIEALVPALVDEFFEVLPLLKQAAPGLKEVIEEREAHMYTSISELKREIPTLKQNGLKVTNACPVGSSLKVTQSQVNVILDNLALILKRIKVPACHA